MSVAKVTEISATSKTSFDNAIAKGIERANKTLDEVKGAWVNEMKVDVEGGKIVEYRATLHIAFLVEEHSQLIAAK